MGHRALVAVENADGRYRLYHDQWGGQALIEGADPASVVAGAVAADRCVGTCLGVADVLDALDPREYEALFVRDSAGAVSAFAVVRLGLDLATGTAGDGAAALVPVRDGAQVRRLRRAVRDATDWLGDAVDAGVLSGPAAVAWLRAILEVHPAAPEGTIPLPPDTH